MLASQLGAFVLAVFVMARVSGSAVVLARLDVAVCSQAHLFLPCYLSSLHQKEGNYSFSVRNVLRRVVRDRGCAIKGHLDLSGLERNRSASYVQP